MSKRTLRDGHGATSKHRSNIAIFAKRPTKTGNNDLPMKAIVSSALVVLLAMVFSASRSSAEETQPAEMHLYPPTSMEWKAGPAAIPPGAKMVVLEGDPTKEGPFVVRF